MATQPTGLEPEIHSPESRRVSKEIVRHPLDEKIDEKIHQQDASVDVGVGEVSDAKDSEHPLDPYTPFPESEFAEENDILRIRSLFVGVCLGALVNASNLYLGLKTGWTFSANMFGAIFGFAIIKALSVTKIPILGGYFGPKENNIIQTAATAAGGLGTIFVSAIPAMYQMGLMSDSPSKDYWKLICFTAVSAYFGMFFAVPLRKFFIIHIARELALVYPTATATAFTIRSMHMAGTGAANAKKMIRALIWSFIVAFVLRVVSQYAPGILWDWNIFWWFYAWGHYNNLAIHVVNWGWLIEWTPAFIGSGMLVGLNAALSFFFGSVIAWGIIGPLLIHTKVAWGITDPESEYPDLADFTRLSLPDPKNHPSPRYWLLWPGVLLMLAVSFAELAVNYKIIGKAIRAGFRGLLGGINDGIKKMGGKGNSYMEKKGLMEGSDDEDNDPALPHEMVPTWMWMTGAIGTIIFTCVVLGLQFRFPVGVSILSLILAFFFSFLAIQCTGATDTTPITTVSKASQLIIGGVTKGAGTEMKHAQGLNLMSGAVSAGAASQASDLVNDFKVGFLLRTPPRIQWYAQMIGSFIAVWMAPTMFVLFTKAYPCIVAFEGGKGKCDFRAPSVSAWRAVALAMTDPTFPIPRSSGIFAIIISIVGVAVVLLRHWLGTKESTKKYVVYVPNMMVLGLAFLLPQTQYGTAMSMGALTAYIWRRKNKNSFETYCFSIAAGMIAGEGIGGVVNALFQVLNIAGGATRGTMIGCPGGSC